MGPTGARHGTLWHTAERRWPRIVVGWFALLGSVLALLPAEPAEAAAAYQQPVSLTYPTSPRSGFTRDYHAPRGGGTRVHKSTDIFAPKHTPLYSAVDGVVCRLYSRPQGNAGYAISICGDDGRRYAYLHVNNDTPGTDDGRGGLKHAYAPGMRVGLRVARGQLIGWLGDSGNAERTPPHLHFEIHDRGVTDPYGDNRRDPFASLRAALARGDVSDGSAVYLDPAQRVAGRNWLDTAVALSRGQFETAPAVVLVPADGAADALVAGPLATSLGGPVLPVLAWGLDPLVSAEIARLKPEEVALVGRAFPVGIEQRLFALGVPADGITRYAGRNDYETAAAVAERVWEHGRGGGAPPDPVVEGPPPTSEPSILVSSTADRTGSVRLDGAELRGEVAIHFDPDGLRDVDEVAFWLDDPDAAGRPFHVERHFPYDFSGTNGDRAHLFDFGDLEHGEHTVTVAATVDGEVEWRGSATFEVLPIGPGLPTGVVDGDGAASGPELHVSPNRDRSDPVLLDGARIGGEISVALEGVDPRTVREVRFWIDDPDRTGDPDQDEQRHPYDLRGGENGGARLWDTRELTNGGHTVTAEVELLDGSVTIVIARFTVANRSLRTAVIAMSGSSNPVRGWSESLTAGYYGGVVGAPVLLVSDFGLPAATAAALAEVERATIIGLDDVVKPAIRKRIVQLVPATRRLGWHTRASTAATVARDAVENRGADLAQVWVAGTGDWREALFAAPIVARRGEVLLVVDGGDPSRDPEPRNWLQANAERVESLRVVGRSGRLGDRTMRTLAIWIT